MDLIIQRRGKNLSVSFTIKLLIYFLNAMSVVVSLYVWNFKVLFYASHFSISYEIVYILSKILGSNISLCMKLRSYLFCIHKCEIYLAGVNEGINISALLYTSGDLSHRMVPLISYGREKWGEGEVDPRSSKTIKHIKRKS